jgi:hypothetical protein
MITKAAFVGNFYTTPEQCGPAAPKYFEAAPCAIIHAFAR